MYLMHFRIVHLHSKQCAHLIHNVLQNINNLVFHIPTLTRSAAVNFAKEDMACGYGAIAMFYKK